MGSCKAWAESHSTWLCSRFTTAFLLFLAGLSLIINFNKPISCFTPAQFTASHVQYADKTCFDADIHHAPYSSRVPHNSSSDPSLLPAYYHTIPLLFLCMALVTTIPYLFWTILSFVVCPSIASISDAVRDCMRSSAATGDEKQHAIRFMSGLINSFKRQGSPVIFTLGFLLVQILNVLSSLALLVMVDNFLCATSSTHQIFHGYHLLNNLRQEVRWLGSENLPSDAMCNFSVRRLGNVQRFTVQCELSVNTYHYMLLLVTWLWLLVLLVVSLVNVIHWILVIFTTSANSSYIRMRLVAMATTEPDSDVIKVEAAVQAMASRNDEVLMVRLLSYAGADWLASRMLWEMAKTGEPTHQTAACKL